MRPTAALLTGHWLSLALLVATLSLAGHVRAEAAHCGTLPVRRELFLGTCERGEHGGCVATRWLPALPAMSCIVSTQRRARHEARGSQPGDTSLLSRPLRTWRLGIGGMRAPVGLDPAPPLPGWRLFHVDAGVERRVRWHVSLWLRNLLNRYYLNTVGLGVAVPLEVVALGESRVFGASARAEF